MPSGSGVLSGGKPTALLSGGSEMSFTITKRVEFRVDLRDQVLVQAVFDVPPVIDNDYVLHPRALISLLCLVAHLIKVLAARETLNAQSDPGEDGLSLLNHETRVRAGGSEIDVVLRAKSDYEQRCQQKQEPNSEAV